MDNVPGPPTRSGGIDVENSDVQAQDFIGRDKIEFNLPPIVRRGCYAQLSEHIKFAVFLGIILLLIYAVFKTNSLRVARQTPTPTVAETATPVVTLEPEATPAADDGRLLLETVPAAPPLGGTRTVVRPAEETPTVTATASRVASATPTPTARRVAVTATLKVPSASTPVVRPPTPTPHWTPTPVPATPTPKPHPTSTPRPPTPTPNPCPSASVRLGPVAKLVTEGDTFTVSALVSCAVNVAGYQVKLRYDPSVVVVRRVNNGGFLASAGGSVFVAGPNIDNDAGSATIGGIVLRPGPYPSGSGTLAVFTLEAVGPGSTALELSASLSDVNGRAIPTGVTGGAAVVQARSTATPGSP